MFRAIPFLLLGLSTPALAQQLGGVEGQGSQTQSLELLNGSISVTLESSGSLSLGQGDTGLAAGFDLSVNDTTIVGLGNQNEQQSTAQAEASVSDAQAAKAASSSGAEAGTASTAAPISPSIANSGSTSTSDSSLDCPSQNLGADQLAAVLTPGQQIWMRPMNCPILPSSQQLVAGNSELSNVISSAGMFPEEVVAVTFSDELVIIGIRP